MNIIKDENQTIKNKTEETIGKSKMTIQELKEENGILSKQL
jgi:hypothetical protein